MNETPVRPGQVMGLGARTATGSVSSISPALLAKPAPPQLLLRVLLAPLNPRGA